MSKFLILFNHRLTDEQELDAIDLLGVKEFSFPPVEIGTLWKSLPPDAEKIGQVLRPVFQWIDMEGGTGDYLLVQGDFGATYLVVEYARARDLKPVYATTRRISREIEHEDGSIEIVHRFRHVRFREYGK